MKKNLLILLVLLTLKGYCQWNDNGNSLSTGNLTVGGSFISTNNYGLKLEPVSGDAVIKRNNAGNLNISSGGGDSQVRFNFNYGGGSGGIMVYDGGVTNHGDLWVTNGELNISASGRHVVVGTSAFPQKLSVKGDLVVGIENTLSTISGPYNGGAIQIRNHASLGGAANRNLRLGWIDNNAVFYPVLAINEDYKVGIGTLNPLSKLDVLGQSATGMRTNGTASDFEALSIFNTTAADLASGNGAVIQFYNNCNNNNAQIGASIKSVSSNNLYGWESDLYLRTTRMNGSFQTQTILNALVIKGGSGNVGIGTTNPDKPLTVKGTIHTNEVLVDMESPIQGPDYVFEKDYNLLSLAELEAYIKVNKHLPEVPSAKEMAENGLNLKEMNLLLLKKVEELTLHLIEMKKENAEIADLKKRIELLEKKER